MNARDDYPHLAEIADPPRPDLDRGNPCPDEARRALDEIDLRRRAFHVDQVAALRAEWRNRNYPARVQR